MADHDRCDHGHYYDSPFTCRECVERLRDWDKCDECEALRAKVAELEAALALSREFNRKAGHLLWCSQLAMQQGWRGRCTCGLAELGVE